MGRMIWNPETGQFEEQYVLPMPPTEPQPEPEPEPEPSPAPASEFERRVQAARMGVPVSLIPSVVESKPGIEKPWQPREYTPEQLLFRSRVEQYQTSLKYARAKRGIDPSATYQVPQLHGKDASWKEVEAYRRETGQPDYRPSYRIVTGSQVLGEMKEGFDPYQKEMFKFHHMLKKGAIEWHPKTKLIPTETGYDIKFPYAGAEKYAHYKKQLETDWTRQVVVKLTADDILGIPSFIESMRGETQKSMDIQIQALHKIISEPVLTAVQSHVAQLPWYFVGGAAIKIGLGYTAGKLAFKPIASVLATKIIPTAVGGVMLTHAGLDIKQTFERGDIGRAAGKLTGLGMVVVGFGVGYKLGAKVTFKGLTPKQVGYAKALKPEPKIDFAKMPVLKQIHGFKEYHMDIRIARGMKFGDLTQPSYGKLPAYVGRMPYGKKGFVSTLEQMKGTLIETGFRGADPLKAAAWQQYHSLLTQPKITPRMLTAIKYTYQPSGKWTISPVYNIKLRMPELATGEMPLPFRTAQVPIKVTGYKIMKVFTLKRPPSIDKVTDVVTSKTGISVAPSKTGLQSVVSTQLRSLKITFKRGLTLKELESLKPPYETYVYPTGTRIGVQFPMPSGKIISPVTGLSLDRFSGNLYRSVFGDVGIQKRQLDFRQLLKRGQKQITDISHKQIYKLTTGTTTALGTLSLSLQTQLLAQESATKSLLKQKQALMLKQVSLQKTSPLVFPRTPVIHKPIKPIHTPVVFPSIPLPIIHGRGRRFQDLELFGKKYKFRMFELESPFKKKKKKKKGGKKK